MVSCFKLLCMAKPSWPLCTLSIRRVLGMPLFVGQLPDFSLNVHAVTRGELASILATLYGKSHPLSTYVSITNFTKST